MVDIILFFYRFFRVYFENRCLDRVDMGNLFIGRMILRFVLSLVLGRLERDIVGICLLKIIIMMIVGDVFFNLIKILLK